MDLCRNVPEPFCFQSEYQTETALCPLDDLFPSQTSEGDVNLEWLSIFVEDCLSSSGNCINPPQNPHQKKPCFDNTNKTHQTQTPPPSKLHNIAVPAKPRTKRKRASHAPQTQPSFHLTSDPPLLHQAYWLADSELIKPNKDDQKCATTTSTASCSTNSSSIEGDIDIDDDDEEDEEKSKETYSGSCGVGGVGQGRRCMHCLSQRTPQWRAGPLGPKTLCNACGVRFKSGRLLPEYRPAKSPTFVSYKHSNSHKKVLEMRMAVLSNSLSSASPTT